MNPRTPLLLAPRSGTSSNSNGTHSQRETASKTVRAPGTAVSSNKSTQSVRTGPQRPTRINTAVGTSSRKASAPGKLISLIGGSLESLPETVSVRRKTSAPVKSSGPNNNNNVGSRKVSSGTVQNKVKKNSAPSTLGPRMSKDHGGSTGQQSSSKSGSAANPTKETSQQQQQQQQKVPSKKISASAGPPDVQHLPTVREEKQSKATHRKMETKSKENQPPMVDNSAAISTKIAPPQPTQPPDSKTITTTTTSTTTKTTNGSSSTSSSLSSAPSNCNCPDNKNPLEKTISDLVKNCESKKQEIAALKMEINRLKEALKERGHCSSDEENQKSASLKCGGPSASSTPAATNPSKSCTSDPDISFEKSNQLSSTVQKLSAENKLLRDRLLQLGVSLDSSPLSDQEKEMLLSNISMVAQNGGDVPSSCDRAEWDNKSTSSLSEISVACLQDRIQQMEETHYCTNEELQATLQELDDLREQLSECHLEVQQLQETKQVILESLTQQTEKLNEARSQNDNLKQMLIHQSENSQDVSQCEKTQRLMDLLKSAQEDRELLQLKKEELEQQITTTKEAEERFHHDSQLIRDRMKMLEAMVEAANNEKKTAENHLAEALESSKATEIEILRLTTALDSAKEKITELEAAVISGEKSELADVLEKVKQEKNSLEKENSSLQQKCNSAVCENERIKDQLSNMQDKLMVARNNAKAEREDADWSKSQLEKERLVLEEERDRLHNTVEDLKITCQHHLEDKRGLKANISESQKKLSETIDLMGEKERIFDEERTVFNKQVEDWNKFQNDLLTTVRVANDFKTEAQHDLERLSTENVVLRDRLKQLGHDLEKAKAVKVCSPLTNSSSSLTSGNSTSERRTVRTVPPSLPNGEPSIFTDRRTPRPVTRGDSRVKSLIESIECATRQTRANSRSSSTSSLCSTGSESNTNKTAPILKRADTESIIRGSSSPLKDTGNTIGTATVQSPLKTLQRNSFTEGITQSSFVPSSFSKTSVTSNLSDNVKMSQLTDKISGKLPSLSTVENKPLSILSNKLDHNVRRNSYGQIGAVVDKKDPLALLAQGGGSKRNALLKWCQNQTMGYSNVDITNFSSSWNDGLALCAILDTYLPEKVNYKSLSPANKRENFEVAISAAESVGIPNVLDVNDMMTSERPNWQTVYNYVTSIYSHFET